jgi:predicted transcriptional regulator
MSNEFDRIMVLSSTRTVVAARLSNAPLPLSEVPDLIQTVYDAFAGKVRESHPSPAVPLEPQDNNRATSNREELCVSESER